MKHTPVQWLEIVLIWDPIGEEEFKHNMNCWKQAKEMEKEQTLKFGIKCQMDFIKSDGIRSVDDIWEETFKTNEE
jgi:hypothetical protein